MRENDPSSTFNPGEQRQRCIDQEWPRSLRAGFMTADTVVQYQEAFFGWCRGERDAGRPKGVDAMCF